MRKSGGLDFEAEGRHAEVQKEREIAEDWTLRRRGGTRKSKRSENSGGLDLGSGGVQEKVQKG